ncbi:MAG: helix-turn-helix domain-containing protein [Chloroflexi bacterium]|nr:helix-turn-helix domain-containing protein [Chloroflexota bacterium]
MADIPDREWLNLSEAAHLLGVHPSSVRTWADKGELPSQRTSGGHRRFRRPDLEQWAVHQRKGPPPGASLVIQSALGRARMEMSDGHLSQLPWYAKLSETARAAHREASHKLLDLLRRYLAGAQNGEREPLLIEARQMGADYYRLGKAGKLSLAESVRAFLYFRAFLTESVLQMVEAAGNRPPQSLAELHQLTSHFTNEILVALVEAHETERKT